MRAHFCSTVRNNNDLAFTGFAQPFQIAHAVAQVSVQTGNFGVEFGGAWWCSFQAIHAP